MDRGARVWAYSGRPEDRRIRYTDHRKLGHIVALFQEGRHARIADAGHFHLEHPHWLLLPLWLVAKRLLGFEWIKVMADGTLPERYANSTGLSRWLFDRALASATEFVPVSNELADWLRATVKVTQKVTVVRTVLPVPPEWGDEPIDSATEKTLAEYSKHARRVCSVGMFIELYGFHHVAVAVDKLREETGLDVGLLLVDGAVAEEPGFRKSILKDRPWIDVVACVPQSTLTKTFHMSDAFVRGFAAEGYGLTRIEALWAGVPVVAANSTEVRGMLAYEFDDIATLAKHLRDIFEGHPAPDSAEWAEKFRKEAEHSLAEHLRILGGE
jgi:glycosyltransferase involved in cell wall biosynthesis